MSDGKISQISVSKIFLDLDNPRHENCQSEAECIEKLCKNEKIYNLAKDIVKNGFNPMDIFGLIKDEETKTYIVGEGNRRVCALKLLHDPSRAPQNLKGKFESLSKKFAKITEINAHIFKTREDLDLWLERLHNSQNNGIGRKAWNAEQQSRFTGGKKYGEALTLLDYAEQEELISADERNRKITTVERYLANKSLLAKMFLKKDKEHGLTCHAKKEIFDKILKEFIDDLVSGKINSRCNQDDITDYATSRFSEIDIPAGTSIEDYPLLIKEEPNDTKGVPTTTTDTKKIPSSEGKERKPLVANDKIIKLKTEKQTKINFSKKIHDEMKGLGLQKIKDLYYCICSLNLDEYAPLLYVGAWSILETISKACGREERASFPSFFSKEKVQKLCKYPAKSENNQNIRSAISRISEHGNSTKHHPISAGYNGAQLANDMDVLQPLLLACLKEIGNIESSSNPSQPTLAST
jgi:hypothetical protein